MYEDTQEKPLVQTLVMLQTSSIILKGMGLTSFDLFDCIPRNMSCRGLDLPQVDFFETDFDKASRGFAPFCLPAFLQVPRLTESCDLCCMCITPSLATLVYFTTKQCLGFSTFLIDSSACS